MESIKDMVDQIDVINKYLERDVQSMLNNLTKPLGSLGKLEDTAKRVACALNDPKAEIKKKCIIVFAADHGITEEGISLYPKEVTAQMVHNFLSGGAAINVLARHEGADLVVVDIGVDAVFDYNPALINKKIKRGTMNMFLEPAMSKQEAIASIKAGYEVALELIDKGYNIIGLGEMGIGNTTAASAVTSVITGHPAVDVTGRGTGIDDHTLHDKAEIIERVIHLNAPKKDNGIDILSKVGGLELGGIAGAVLACAGNHTVAVIDGFISAAGAAIAYLISPRVKDYMIASHKSAEEGHIKLLEFMGLKPIFDLDMRLGEGTGSALCMNIIDASSKILNEMATFDSAKVSKAGT